MAIDQVVSLLIAERDRLHRAIQILQDGGAKRRGRPPKNPSFNYNHPSVPDWVKPKSALVEPKKHGRRFSAAQRKAASERMRLRWAAKRKAEAKSQPKTVRRSKKRAKAA